MRQLVFVCIVLAAGAAGGVVHGAANLAMVEPFLDRAIEAENMALFESGQASDTVEFRVQFEQYREWQKGGQVLAGAIMGTAYGALFGIVYALSRHALPGRHDAVKSLALAGAMWAVLFLVPFAKYPAELPGTGDPSTAGERAVMFAAFVAVSGAAAVGAHRTYRAVRRRGAAAGGRAPRGAAGAAAAALAVYGVAMAAAGAAFPGAEGQAGAWWDGGAGEAGALAQAEVGAFRAASAAGTAIFWAAMALFMGAMWHRARPDMAQPVGGGGGTGP